VHRTYLPVIRCNVCVARWNSRVTATIDLTERSITMKRTITVLATALLASSLLAGAADARGGGGGGGHGGGVGGGGHMGGGFGGAHMGGFGGDHIGTHDFGLHQHAAHRFGGYGYYGNSDCYDWYVLHPNEPLPLSCS
jgi:hypothetical protein